MPAFVLRIQDIEQHGKEFSFPLTASWLNDQLSDTELSVPESFEEGRVEVRAQPSGKDFVLDTHIQTHIVSPCSRCLEDVPLEVDLEVTSLFSPKSTLTGLPDEIELAEEDLDQDWFEGDKIVLDDLIREHILLEVPMRILCEKGEDCPGIEVPAHIKGPDNLEGPVDPRLAPLLKLKGQTEQE